MVFFKTLTYQKRILCDHRHTIAIVLHYIYPHIGEDASIGAERVIFMAKLISIILALSLSMPVFAWGQTGHRVTGAIAEKYLSAEAKAAIEAILGTETLAEASSWPDEQRSNASDFWQKEAGPYHYLTVPKDQSYGEVSAPEQGDAYTALKKFAGMVKDPNETLENKQLALRFIVHIIGDLHQPLHAGNGTDRGGNDVKLKYFGSDTNLHSVWDTQMIDGEKLSYTELSSWLGAKITDEQAQAWTDTNPLTWIGESTAIRDTIYPDSDTISWSYRYNHIDTVKTRLSMAGVRIAAYLNALFNV